MTTKRISGRIASLALVLAVVFTAFTFSAFSGPVFATDANFNTKEFNVNVDVNKDGYFVYKEEITVDFFNAAHGIFRNIPCSKNYKISDVSVPSREFSKDDQENNLVIKIGSPDYTVSGIQKYTLRYKIRGVADTNKKMDMLYLDLLPTGWNTDIPKSHITVNFPQDMDLKDLKIYCGSYGSTDGDISQYGTYSIDDNTKTLTIDAADLPEGTGITIKNKLPEGYWLNPIDYRRFKLITMILLLATLGSIIVLKLKKGRSPAIVETVEFYPPEGLTPIEVGYVIDTSVDKKDVISMIFYLADRGYIDIKEIGPKEFEFTLLKLPRSEDESQSTMSFFNIIFEKSQREAFEAMSGAAQKSDSGNGEQSQDGSEAAEPVTVSMSEVGERLGYGMSDIREYVMDDFAGERSIYTEESVTASGVGLLFAFLGSAFALMTAIIPPAYSTGEKIGYAVMSVVLAGVVVLILRRMRTIIEKRASRNKAGTAVKLFLDVVLYAFFGGIIMFFMSDLGENNRASTLYAFVLIALPFLICKMKSRSEWSAKLIGQLRGFRNFIADAEVPKLEELIEQDPKFFYHALPYAYVFGLTKKWASSFEKIDIGKPDWYEPYAVDEDYVFDALMMNSMFSNVSHDLGRNITVPSLNTDDSGGGDFGDFGDGFSGGGFSGGGFGGGGGGSW